MANKMLIDFAIVSDRSKIPKILKAMYKTDLTFATFKKLISLITITSYMFLSLSACGVRQVKLASPPAEKVTSKKSVIPITIIDTREKIPDFNVDLVSVGMNYNVKDTIFDVVKDAVSASYETVSVTKDTSQIQTPLYAVFNVQQQTAGKTGLVRDKNGSTGMTTTLTVDVFDASTKQRLVTNQVSEFSTWPASEALITQTNWMVLLTVGLAFPIAFKMRVDNFTEASTKMMNENAKQLSASLSKSIEKHRIVDLLVAGQTRKDLPDYQKESNRFRVVSPELSALSKAEIEKCKSQITWTVGTAAKRVECLNEAWTDYSVASNAIIGEFKSWRLAYAKKLDATEITMDEYNEREKDGLANLMWKASFVMKGENAVASTTSSGNTTQDPQVNTPAAQGQSNTSMPSTIANAVVGFLGLTLQIALAAAPYALGYAAGSNATANAWASYANRPRVMTCTPAGRSAATCI